MVNMNAILHISLSLTILLSSLSQTLYAGTEQIHFQGHTLPIGVEIEDGLPYLLSQSSNSSVPDFFSDLYNIPLDQVWVSLKPGLRGAQVLGKWVGLTPSGKYLVEADILLKQIGSQILNELLGQPASTTEENTQIRFWIEPDNIKLLDTGNIAIIKSATLKVNFEVYNPKHGEDLGLSALIGEYVIPKLTHLVNLDPRFSKLRQIYFTLILIRWLKQRHLNLTILRLNNYLYHFLYPTQWSLREVILRYARLYFSDDSVGIGGIFLSRVSKAITKIKATSQTLRSYITSVSFKIPLIPWKQFVIGVSLLTLILTTSIGLILVDLIKKRHFDPEKILTEYVLEEKQLFNQKILSSLRPLGNDVLGLQLKVDRRGRLHITIKDFQRFLAALRHPFFYNYIFSLFFSDNIILKTPYISPDFLYNLYLTPENFGAFPLDRIVRNIMSSETFKSDLKDLVEKASKGQRDAVVSLSKTIALANAVRFPKPFKEVLDKVNIPANLRKIIEELVRCSRFSIVFENVDSPYCDLIEASLFYTVRLTYKPLKEVISIKFLPQNSKKSQRYLEDIDRYLNGRKKLTTIYGYFIHAMAFSVRLWIMRDFSKLHSSNPYLGKGFIEFIKKHQDRVSQCDLIILLQIIRDRVVDIIPEHIGTYLETRLSKRFNFRTSQKEITVDITPSMPYQEQLRVIEAALNQIKNFPSRVWVELVDLKIPLPHLRSPRLYLEQNRVYRCDHLSDLIFVYMILNNPPLVRNILLSHPEFDYTFKVEIPPQEFSTKPLDQRTMKKILTLFYTMPFPLANTDTSEFEFGDYRISGKFLISVYLTKAFQEAFSEYDVEQQIQFLMATINHIMWNQYIRSKGDTVDAPITIDEITRAIHAVKANWNYIKGLKISIPKKKNMNLIILSFNPPNTFRLYDRSSDILKMQFLKISNRIKLKCHTNSMDTFFNEIKKTKGPLWIVVDTHGFYEAGDFFLISDNGEKRISVDLVYTSLLEYAKQNNGNLSQVVIFAENCFSGFWEKVMQRLVESANKGKISSLPLIISSSPILSTGWVYALYPVVESLQKYSPSITIEKIFSRIKGRHQMWYSVITGKQNERKGRQRKGKRGTGLFTMVFLSIPTTVFARKGEEEDKDEMKRDLDEILDLLSPEITGERNLLYDFLRKNYNNILAISPLNYGPPEDMDLEMDYLLKSLERIPNSEEDLRIQEDEKRLLYTIAYYLSKRPEELKQLLKNRFKKSTYSSKTKRGGISL